ncbi:hypothetical protein JNUCC0626_24345 [Lentzea sp. JNUCC 0626]|uniref:hypothetical protein n=1 Tax=Lentzea sp. JNUCC 0626 TaxID=3367513 RepID=UPI00374A1663
MVWVRLFNARYPIPGGTPGLAWALWQTNYKATPWPHDELKPDFGYYICESLDDGTRAITHKALMTHVLPPTKAETPEAAYDLAAEHVFDDTLRIAPDVWHDYHYNALKAEAPWPQRIVAWRASVTPVGPHVVEGLERFPRTGWLKTDAIAL